MRFLRIGILAMLALLLVVPVALATEGTHSAPTQVLSQSQLWVAIIGALSPLVGYVLNSALFKNASRRVPEPLLAAVHVAIAAIGAAIYTLVESSTFGWNAATLQLILTSVAAAFAAHGFVWKPSGVTARLARHQPVVAE